VCPPCVSLSVIVQPRMTTWEFQLGIVTK